ncbi:MAG TPA: hypothetical protein VD763_06370, partial [Candidatus Saccharimonadales bacterium]|nr:hypothetical protein [Candidatus Saccharimonadales bacterium]
MARAKSTARAEARRRYRAEHGLPAEPIGTEGLDGESGGDPRATPTNASTAGQPERIGIGQAFRQSFRGVDVRADLRALPFIATRTKALWVPLLLTVGSTIAFFFTSGQDIVTRFLFAYFVQTPAIGGVFIAGFLAPRASWLLGVIIGLLSAVCYAIIVLTVFSQASTGAPTPDAAREIVLYGFFLSPVLGAV